MLIGYLLEEDVQSYYESGYLMGRDPPWYDDSLIIKRKDPQRKPRRTATAE
jgi:hypothetical protein